MKEAVKLYGITLLGNFTAAAASVEVLIRAPKIVEKTWRFLGRKTTTPCSEFFGKERVNLRVRGGLQAYFWGLRTKI